MRSKSDLYMYNFFFFLSVGGISQRNTRRVIGISLFMQRPKMDISPIVQFQVKSYYSIVLIELDTGNTKLASAEPAVNIKVNRISCKYFKITIYIYYNLPVHKFSYVQNIKVM